MPATATTSHSNAATSATAAASSATTATTKASEASTSASNAASSATAAAHQQRQHHLLRPLQRLKPQRQVRLQLTQHHQQLQIAASAAQQHHAAANFEVLDDTTPQLGGNLDTNEKQIVTVSNRDLELAPNGTGAVEVRGNTNSGKIILNCEANTHGFYLQAQPHSAGYTGGWTSYKYWIKWSRF